MNNIEELLCSSCSNYLSRSPVFLLPDGKSVCENCSVANSEVKPYRQYTLEATLRHGVIFPCKNKNYGCDETYKFDAGVEHENNCMFNPICCMFNIMFKCDWRGPVKEFGDHVRLQHPSVIQEKAEFQIDLNETKKESFLVLQESNLFLVNYNYESISSQLVYVVAFYNFNIKTQFCKIRLTNTDDIDSTIEFKGCKCISYFDGLLSNSDIGKSINLHELISILGNPKSLSIVLTVKNNKSDNSVKQADYDLLNSYKCCLCRYFLILPLFRMQGFLICNTCHYNKICDPVPLDSTESLLLAKANYPCKWHNCNQTLKGDLIGDHNTKCEFRIYSCVCCDLRLTYVSLKEHIVNQNGVYFDEQLEIKVSFIKIFSSFAFVKHELLKIFINYCKHDCDGNYVNAFRAFLSTTSVDKEKIQCLIKFQHDHCKAESANFKIVNAKDIFCSFTEMPNCFRKNDKLTAIIKFL